jgi:hypothetical protein
MAVIIAWISGPKRTNPAPLLDPRRRSASTAGRESRGFEFLVLRVSSNFGAVTCCDVVLDQMLAQVQVFGCIRPSRGQRIGVEATAGRATGRALISSSRSMVPRPSVTVTAGPAL